MISLALYLQSRVSATFLSIIREIRIVLSNFEVMRLLPWAMDIPHLKIWPLQISYLHDYMKTNLGYHHSSYTANNSYFDNSELCSLPSVLCQTEDKSYGRPSVCWSGPEASNDSMPGKQPSPHIPSYYRRKQDSQKVKPTVIGASSSTFLPVNNHLLSNTSSKAFFIKNLF